MNVQPDIERYDITCGEKIQYGYYAALEVVFKKYIGELESYFFDEFNLSFQFDFEIKTGMKFREYLNGIEQPTPIFIYGLSPLKGDCLFLMENRSANLILAKAALNKSKRISLSNRFQLNAGNSRDIQHTVEDLLDLFQKSWENIFTVNSKLKKLVSNKIKAKVMNPAEACIAVKINMTQNNYAAYWEFCFSAYQLDQIIKKYGAKVLLAGKGEVRENQKIREYFTDLLLKESSYELRGIIGELNISQKELEESYHSEKVLPLKNVLNQNVIIQLNKVPILSASAGVTHENLSLQVNGKFEKVKVDIKQQQKPFSKLQFPFQS
ncbi:MAG: hypothetical protein GY866_11615 [Proteobacteria bacterium]|nr:hypothetical protein [Pseudomonadota bacterium]